MPRLRLTGGRLRQRMRRDDPGLAPDWDWQFALQCAASTQRPSMRFDGYWACAATRLARALHLDSESAEIRLTRRHRPCWHTIRLAWQLARTEGPSRWALDAMVLAGLSDAQIAATAQIPDAVVECYASLFYGVRQRLRYRSYILSQVLHVDAPWTGRDVGRVWGWFAYIGGPVVLQALRAEFTAMGRTDYCDLATDIYRNDLVALAANLRAGSACPIIALAVDRVVLTWLALSRLESRYANAAEMPAAEATTVIKAKLAAERAHQSALRTLATVRQLMADTSQPTRPASRRDASTTLNVVGD